MTNKFEGFRRYFRIALPSIGLMILAAACSSQPEPTVDEIREALPQPIINPGNTLVYTNKPDAEFIVGTQNLYDDHPEISINPAGASAEWMRGSWFNPFSPKNRLKITGMSQPNTAYTVSLSGENCTTHKGDLVCTDPILQTVDIIYDTLPPQANIVGFESVNGKLVINARITDNLAGPKDNTVSAEVKNPLLGVNKTKIKICDNAENCITATVEGKYDPFTNVISMEKPRYDQKTGQILISGTINNEKGNLDLEKTSVGAKQAVLPEMAFDINKASLVCGVPEFEGFSFQMTCKPKSGDGRTIVKVTIKDKLGNKYEQKYEVEIPPLSREKSSMFYFLLALALVTDTGLFAKIRGDRVRRQRRATLASAMVSGNLQKVQDAKKGLVRKDKKRFADVETELRLMKVVEEGVSENKSLVRSLTALKVLYKKSPHFLSEKRDDLLLHVVGLIGRSISGKSWKSLEEDGKTKEILNFIWSNFNNPEYNFFWKTIDRISGFKTSLVAAMLMLKSLKKPSSKEMEIGDKRVIYSLGLHKKENLMEYLYEMVQWGDFKTIEKVLVLLNIKPIRGETLNYAIDKIDSEQRRIIALYEGLLTGIDQVTTLQSKREKLEEIKSDLLKFRFTDAASEKISKLIMQKEAQFEKLVLVDSCNQKIRSELEGVIETVLNQTGKTDSTAPDKNKLIIDSLPSDITSLLSLNGELYRYVLSETLTIGDAEKLLKKIILIQMMPHALFYGTSSMPDANHTFKDIFDFDGTDRELIKKFAELLNQPDQNNLSPRNYILRAVWNRIQFHNEAKNKAKQLEISTNDLLLYLDNSVGGKVRTLLFMAMAKLFNFTPKVGENNVLGWEN